MKKLTYLILLALILSTALSAQFGEPCLPEGITFSTQAEIDSFPIKYSNCIEIEGDVTICGDDISNINGLSGLTSFGGDLDIGRYEYWGVFGNSSLTSLMGLDNLNSIGGRLLICANESLTSLSSLDNLTSIGGDLCIGGNDVLSNLTALENVTSIGGDLSIGLDLTMGCAGNPSLINLTGLEGLTSIEGGLSILWNDTLTSLAGLDNVTSIGGGIEMRDNPYLTSFAGLDNVTSIGGGMYIFNNSLTSFAGLDNVTSIGAHLWIFNELALTSLAGLDSVTSIGGTLVIDNNHNLASLIGLDNVTSIGGDLKISGTSILTSLAGLNGVTSIGGDIEIDYNQNLVSITELNNVTSIGGDLKIERNNALISLVGLDNIDGASIEDLYIAYNSSLSTCNVQSICVYLVSPNGTIEIHKNATWCSSQEEVEYACTVSVEESQLSNQLSTYPNPFSNLTTIEFELTQPGKAEIKIFNQLGELIEDIQKTTQPGKQVFTWDASDLPSGIYFIRLQTGNSISTKKIIKL